MGQINSHKRVPKCVLKQFQDEKYFVYFWDLEKGWILNRHAESINTEEGYYSEKMEAFLRDNIETPLGHILGFIKRIEQKDPRFTMGNEKKDIIRRYVYALIARSGKMLTLINEKSIYAQFLSKQEQHDHAVISGLQGAVDLDLFGNWEITFIENHTSIPFVLPLCGTYSFSFNGDTMFSVPVTPHYAITFMHPSAVPKYVVDDVMRLFQVVEPYQAMMFNKFALSSELKDSCYGIAANSRSILEGMKTEYEKQTAD